MASLRTNGVRQQSGAGTHPSKVNPPRSRTRSAAKRKAIESQVGNSSSRSKSGSSDADRA